MWYSEVIQAIRRYRPSQVVPFLAEYSSERERAFHAGDTTQWYPWAISAIAKESVLRGNEFRSSEINLEALAELVHDFNGSGGPLPEQTPASMLTPILYEQFPYQEPLFEEMARAHLLFAHDEPGQTPTPWEEVLGVGLDQAIRASHVLHAWVNNNGGRYDPAILDMPHFQEVFERVAPRSEIEATASLLTSTIDDLKRARVTADRKQRIPAALERYAFNPLKARPLVDMGARGIWAPQTMLVPRAFLGANLYYRGLDRWGKPFADGLGKRVESYVGRQLALLDGIQVHPEVEYIRGKRSIDWMWVTDEAVILVECKAARMTLDAQAGGDTLESLMERYIGGARKQIDTTARLIRENHPAFKHIPNDRPIVSVITTAEPFYLADTPFSGYISTGEVPAMTMSLRELEVLVGYTEPEAAAMVIEHANRDGDGGRFVAKFDDAALQRHNPILEEAWLAFDFLERELNARTP